MKVLEDALDEMQPGEERTLEIAAADAYGEYDQNAVQHIPTNRIPDGDTIPAGQLIMWKSPNRPQPVPAKVLSVENMIATLDFNHPLAGKDIIYWLKLVSVE
jgi:peptidylprolyl isomerase